MSEQFNASPLLDGYLLGQTMSEHQGVRCIPALLESTEQPHIVKIISVPASQTQLDALLLSGAYRDAQQAQAYFLELAQSLAEENELLTRLSKLEGFVPNLGLQIQKMDSGVGYEVCLLSPYRSALDRLMIHAPLTHLSAVNLGLDMCAALTACRQAGFLYSDLKPSNIFYTETRGFCIGDLGFIPMASLKYASLPEKYRSSYTAPEITDAYAALNDTLDVYALGLVLYQVYNNGQLPFSGVAPADQLQPPLYADYELSQIILKACHPDPAARWTDPAQMGQELINYMQRNGVEDVPIIPPPVPIIDETEPESEFLSEEENDAELSQLLAMIPDELLSGDDSYQDNSAERTESSEETDSDDATLELSQMLALADELIDHELPEPVVAPDPIDIPIPPPITIEPAVQEPEAEPITDLVTEEAPEDTDAPQEIEEALVIPPLPPVSPIPMMEHEVQHRTHKRPRFSKRLLIVCASLLLLLGLCVGLYLYYHNSYLKTIETLTIHGSFDQVTVQIRTNADESLLSISCSDNYGNTLRSDVINGVAHFSGLKPNYQYRIQVHIYGWHKLIGSTSGSYTASYPADYFLNIESMAATSTDTQITVTVTTDADDNLLTLICTDAEGMAQQSRIVNGQAIFTDLMPNSRYSLTLQAEGEHELTGQAAISCETKEQTRIQNVQFLSGAPDGTVIIKIAYEGTDPGLWTLRYGFDTQMDSITSTLSQLELQNLIIGQEYTFRLEAPGAYLAGQNEWTYVPETLVQAQQIQITHCSNGTIGLEWAASDHSDSRVWKIHCYNDQGYDYTVLATGNSVQITNLDSAMHYTFAITAEGMSQGQTISISANPIEITGFTVENVTDETMDLVWSFDGMMPIDGWVLEYYINNGELFRVECADSQVTLPLTSGAIYQFHVSPSTAITCINGDYQYTA